MTPNEAHERYPHAVVWRLAITGRIARGLCTINLHPFFGSSTHCTQVFADTCDPKHDWLWDIINVAQMGARGSKIPQPPPTYILWFATTKDLRLIDILETT